MTGDKNEKEQFGQNERVSYHAHAHHLHKKRHNLFVALFITLFILAIGFGSLAYLYFSATQSKVDPEALKKLDDALGNTVATQKIVTVKSGFGFSVPYDANVFDSYGFVSNTAEKRKGYSSGEAFQNDELKTSRNYTIVRLTSKDSSPFLKKNPWFVPYLSIVTNFHKDYFDRSKLNAKYKSMSELDILLDKQKIQASKNGETLSSAKKITINGKEFYKVIFEYSYTIVGTKVTKWEYQYLTVNDGSPYFITIGPSVQSETLSYVPLYESLISKITFATHDQNTLVRKNGSAATAKLAAETSDNQLQGINNAQGYINSEDKIKIVARNQLSTVRVGTVRCADLTLKSRTSSQSFTIKDACNGEIGSGSIVSNDGYIVTNGHVVYISDSNLFEGSTGTFTDAQWQEYYKYLLDSNIASYNELNSAISQARAGDSTAYYALLKKTVEISDVTHTNDELKFDIQTSDTPMRLNTASGRWSWESLDGNVLDGKLIDYEVNKQNTSFDYSSTMTDVAILKISGDYPTVRLGSVSTLNIGDTITAIGYPAIVDDGVQTKQAKTVPTVSQGTISQDGPVGGGHILIFSSAQIAAGNSGGPAFDKNGLQVAINTYGGSACDDKGGNMCFGDGASRDIQDAKDMMSKNGVSPSSDGELTKLWNNGIDAFLAGDYSSANNNFSKLNNKYPNNYLVSKIAAIASKQAGTGIFSTQTFATNGSIAVGFAIGAVILLVLAGGSVVAIVIIRKRHLKPYQQAVSTMQPQPMPQSQPVMPVQPPAAQPVTQQPQQTPPTQTPPVPPKV